MRSVAAVAALFALASAQERQVLEADVSVFEAPHWEKQGRATKTDAITPTFMLRHTPESRTEFEKIFYAVSTPGNPRYGKHLSRAEIADLLPLVSGAKENILSMLSEHGVTDVEISHDMIHAPMSVEVAEKIFATEIFEFKHENGVKLLRVGGQYSLPSDVHNLVYNVADLLQLPAIDQPELVEMEHDVNAAFPTCSSGKCGSTSTTPPVLAAQYNFDLNYDQSVSGGKTTLAVAAFQGQSWDKTDLSDFASACNIADVEVADQVGPNTAAECLVPLIGANLCLEALLDVQYSKTTAGNIPLTVISNNQYSLASWAQELANMDDVPPIQSVSYGNDECQQTSSSYMDSVNVQFQKLGAMGVSILFASGDQGVVGRTGKTSSGKYNPDFPAASPYVTAVGGTDLLEKSVIGAEKAWSNGGGGFSDEFAVPDYQKEYVASYLKNLEAAGETPPATAFNAQGRGYPDLAALAGTQNPYCVAADRQLVGVGGTSASCPTTAGMFARINAERSAQGMAPMGFLNPFIYQNQDAFQDVTHGSNPGATGVKGFAALEGWDAATGVGTPNFEKMLAAALKAGEVLV